MKKQLKRPFPFRKLGGDISFQDIKLTTFQSSNNALTDDQDEMELISQSDSEEVLWKGDGGSTRTHRRLEASHLVGVANRQEMIAIGGTIGTGLFLGAGHALQFAGPLGCLTAFSLVGVFVYFVVTSLCEMVYKRLIKATLIPVSGSFNEYASRFIDPALGFSMGWNYWFCWTLTLPIEMSAVSLAMQYWSSAPGWIWSALTLTICTGIIS
jgi:lysine-specific permease